MPITRATPPRSCRASATIPRQPVSQQPGPANLKRLTANLSTDYDEKFPPTVLYQPCRLDLVGMDNHNRPADYGIVGIRPSLHRRHGGDGGAGNPTVRPRP